ncbi:MAG: ComF family protein [Gammaproteobacteria bacterium]|nr:ComF family protein [Gammaproteobacteria bacterium]
MSGRHVTDKIIEFVNYLFAPGLCLACGCELDNAESLCDCCGKQLRRVPNPCLHCGQPNPVSGRICPACMLNPPRWQRLIAPLQYHGLTRDYLQQLKYSEALHLAKTLCRQCFEPFRHSAPKPELLLPVPLHRERLLDRGYNQADEIALLWSREFGIPVERNALTRIRATASQSGLSADQRAKNLRAAFDYRPTGDFRHVAIVDDIVTTGSTVDEITKLLHRAGIEYVEVWALTRVYHR